MAKVRESQYTEEELLKLTRKQVTKGLTDKEIAFCENYIQDYNPIMSAIKAGYNLTGQKTSIIGKIRSRQHVIDYIAWLKIRLYHKAMLSAEDIFNTYAKMAFYDVTDYVEKTPDGGISLKDFEKIDGSIIQEIKQDNKGNISIKFPDRIKSMEKLEKYMDTNPYDWERKIEEQKLGILQEKLMVDKAKAGLDEEMEDDGFIEAMSKAIKEINMNNISEEE